MLGAVEYYPALKGNAAQLQTDMGALIDANRNIYTVFV